MSDKSDKKRRSYSLLYDEYEKSFCVVFQSLVHLLWCTTKFMETETDVEYVEHEMTIIKKTKQNKFENVENNYGK